MKAHRSANSAQSAPSAKSATAVDPGPHIFVAPELRGRSFEVIRHDGDSDEAYALRCELFALATGAEKES
jgi:hypothetical protein